MALAVTSLPVPLSPRISTVEGLRAILAISLRSRSVWALEPTRVPLPTVEII